MVWGMGNFKLLAALGAWVGWATLPMLIACAASMGLGVTLYNDLQAKNYAFWRRRPPLPFGLYLALSGWLCLLWVACRQ
jgi:leader peptidase (prepilin peptidase)/N-methyltransferase